MKIHILGICGTFMGGLAVLARESGHEVTGSDSGVYPPMSDQLAALGIALRDGYSADHIDEDVDLVVIGNALSRGNPEVEAVLDRGLRYTSGAEWLADAVLQDRWVIAVAGTHGKTTTASMVAAILDHAGMQPGFLIGGIPNQFGISARLGDSPFFVIEADEYDTAFFDKRSKFVHYRPRTLVLNNLEFDHADIFDDLAAIERQFHHLVRTVPGSGLIISNRSEAALERVLNRGCWSLQEGFCSDTEWSYRPISADGSHFTVELAGQQLGTVQWSLAGEHNMANAIAAIAASRHAGVPVHHAIDALDRFAGVKRRLELRGTTGGIEVYDDFAHHPTAIRLTIEALRNRFADSSGRLIAILEPRSNTMRLGHHRNTLADALAAADQIHMLRPAGLDWSIDESLAPLGDRLTIYDQLDRLVDSLAANAKSGDRLLVMSNGGFGGIHQRLLARLAENSA